MFFIDIDNGEIINLEQQQLNLILSKLPVLLTDDYQYNKLVYYNLFGYNFPEDVDLIDNFLRSSICDTIICSCNIKIIVDVVNMRVCSIITVSNRRVFYWRDINLNYHPTMYDVLYKYRYHTTLVGLVSSK